MLQSSSLSSRLPRDLPVLESTSTNLWITNSSVVVMLVAIAAVYKGALHPSLGMKLAYLSTAIYLVAQDQGAFSTLRAVDTHLAAVKKVYTEVVSSKEIPSPPNVRGAALKALAAHQVITFVGLAYLLYLGHLPKRACVSVAAFTSSAMTLTRTLTQAIRQRALHDLKFYSMDCKKKLDAFEKKQENKSKRVEQQVENPSPSDTPSQKIKDAQIKAKAKAEAEAEMEARFWTGLSLFPDDVPSFNEEDRDSIFNDSFC